MHACQIGPPDTRTPLPGIATMGLQYERSCTNESVLFISDILLYCLVIQQQAILLQCDSPLSDMEKRCDTFVKMVISLQCDTDMQKPLMISLIVILVRKTQQYNSKYGDIASL